MATLVREQTLLGYANSISGALIAVTVPLLVDAFTSAIDQLPKSQVSPA